jgi:P4 family phage/plasmid primase-like protien
MIGRPSDDEPPRELIYAEADEVAATLDRPDDEPTYTTPSGPPDASLATFRNLASRGWWLVPIPLRKKGPRIKGWREMRIGPEAFDQHFRAPCNAGIILGLRDTDGRYLMDIDLDSPEAIQLADQYLPHTDCVFGRKSKPASHRLYYVRENIPTKRYTDSNSNVIVELRGAGCQTVAPGSVHPSGEPIGWKSDGEPAEIELAELQAAVERLAKACGYQPRATVPAPQPAASVKLADTPVAVDPAVDWYGRCQKYLEKAPDSISGQGGHGAMLRACCEAYRFGLDDSAARQLAVWYNANKCDPPWSEREIEHKLAEAKKLVYEKGQFGMRRKPGMETTLPADTRSNAELHLTDVGNGQRLARRHGSKIRHVSGIGWYVWDGIRWRLDGTQEIDRLAKETVQAMLADSAKMADDAQRRELAKHALASESAVRQRAMMDMAASEPGIAIRAEQLDADPWLLNVNNGIIDLRNGTFHQHDPARLQSKLAPVDYDPDAPCPRFDQFLTEIFGVGNELPQYAARLFGMCLTGDTREQILPILWGEGQNGKSTLVGVIMHIMGDYAGLAAESLLMVGRHEEHPCSLADMQGKRMVVASETESAGRLKMQLIKRLTGDETIKARRMRENYYEFPRTHKTILQTNNKPRINENSKAVWRRVQLIPFNVIIPDDKKDPELLRKLKAEASGILNWLIGGCLDWRRQGLGEPPEVKHATEAYREESDPLQEFLEERCERLSVAWTLGSDLYAAYTRWCEASGEQAMRKSQFREAMLRSGFEVERRHPGRGWKGVELKLEFAPSLA